MDNIVRKQRLAVMSNAPSPNGGYVCSNCMSRVKGLEVRCPFCLFYFVNRFDIDCYTPTWVEEEEDEHV